VTAASVVAISTAVPGRARLRVVAVRGRKVLASRLEERIAGDLGVHTVQANPLTGSVLVRFDPGQVDLRALLTAESVESWPRREFIDRILKAHATSGSRRPSARRGRTS